MADALSRFRQKVSRVAEVANAVKRLHETGIVDLANFSVTLQTMKNSSIYGPQTTLTIQGGRKYPALPAVVDQRGTLTYKQVDDMSTALAHGLKNPHAQKGTTMSRVQLALDVDDLDEAITFYSKLFDTEPAKIRPDYANFAIAEPPLNLVLIEYPGHSGTLNHLCVEVESNDKVHQEIARLAGEGMLPEEQIGTTCCYATQDKVWVTGPARERWEIYTVLSDSETFGTSPDLLAAEDTGGCFCSGDNAGDPSPDVAATGSVCC